MLRAQLCTWEGEMEESERFPPAFPASPPCFTLSQGRNQQEAALISAGPAGTHAGKAWRACWRQSHPHGASSGLLNNPALLPLTQGEPRFLCALQRSCSYSGEGT